MAAEESHTEAAAGPSIDHTTRQIQTSGYVPHPRQEMITPTYIYVDQHGYVPHPRLGNPQPSSIPSNDGSTTIDVAKAVSDSIKKNPFSSQRYKMSPNSCIFTVPDILRRHNDRAYKPTAFSIGPLLYDRNQQADKSIKFEYLNRLVSRVGVRVETLVEAVAELEPVARAHYAYEVKLSPAELVEVLVLDGCFIIEYLRKFGDPSMESEIGDDPIFGMSIAYQVVIHDLMLLENQIPWTVLARLFTLTRDERLNPQYSLPRLVLKFYRFVLPINYTDFEELARHLENPATKYRHILELLREVLIRGAPPLPSEETRFAKEDWEMLPPIPTATELENSGITLKNSKSNRLTILFNNGVLEVSPLRIEDTSEALFRNIIAFEQCVPGCPSAFTSYAVLLDNLINTTEDLDRLQRKGIISYMLNPDDALGFFNKLYNDTALNEFYYPNVCADINAYCRRRRWPRWRALLVRNYFSSPWVIVSTLAAFVLLVLTFLQTIYTMKG